MNAAAPAPTLENGSRFTTTWKTRPATPADNAALIALAAACPMEGDVGLCVDRSPDFFALNRLEGKQWRVAVVEAPDGSPAGCIGIAERHAFVQGQARRVMYVGDLKVHPEHRGKGAAEALIRLTWDACREIGGDEVPTLITVLGGNAAMMRRADGPRGIPPWTRFAGLRAHSVSLLWKRKVPAIPGMRAEQARVEDLREMAELWETHSAKRQFAPAFEAGGLAEWISQAPGLSIENYTVLRGADGRIAAFLGLWDQEIFKQTRVVRYSPPLRAFRIFYNLIAPLVGAANLPGTGKPMRYLTAVNLCVPAGRADLLRMLVLTAYNNLRGKGYAFFTVGLDVKDPLSEAFKGLMAQVTDIDAYVTCPAGRYQGPALDGLPLHFEIALV
jgi:GNAT superfamily N-acetyltransferase